MRRQAPPLEAIEAFIVATRAPSFRAAADRLALSPSAFTRRIQALESFVGTPLFCRDGGSASLTAAGERYRCDVEPAVDAIRRATVDLRAARAGGTIRVMTSQAFAAGWLLPNLPSFVAGAGNIRVEIDSRRDIAALRQGLADIAIITGRGEETGLPHEPLVELQGRLVAAPQMADGRPPPRTLADLPRYPRLGVLHFEPLWDTWLDNVGYDGPDLTEPTNYESQLLVYEAAAAGLGVALAAPLLVDRLLRERRLLPCTDHAASLGVSYVIIYADSAVRRRRDIRAFANWLRETISRADDPAAWAPGPNPPRHARQRRRPAAQAIAAPA